jgi:outer membrane beta-barrel protein
MKRIRALASMAACWLVLVAPVRADLPASADPAPSTAPAAPVPTIQQRFASKAETVSLHLLAGAQLRGDFYHRVGYGAALAYYPSEELGLELRGIHHHAWLTSEAEQVRRETGFVPDTRAPVATFLAGSRYSFGYGKVQLGDAAVVHFDPQAVLHLGATIAEEDRVLPTAFVGLSVLVHFELGFQAQIELLAVVDLEERNARGWVASIGFSPFLTVGWRFDPEMFR